MRSIAMPTNLNPVTDTARYAKCIEVSQRIRWDIDQDVIRHRTFDLNQRFLPDGLSRVGDLEFLTPAERRLMSQIQGRTYANMFGLVERFIGAKVLEISRDHWLGDQTALEALVRFSDEELKHQELFRRLERMAAAGMPDGYGFLPQPNEVAAVVLGKATWAVLALTCHIELFTQAHYRSSIAAEVQIDPLWKDVFLYHWREESQHALLDELEWRRENARLTAEERDRAVDDLIALVAAVDGLLNLQAAADTHYFLAVAGRAFNGEQVTQVQATVLKAYRGQYIVSGVQDPRFMGLLSGMITEAQRQRIATALAPILG
jgi:hypothetical protein